MWSIFFIILLGCSTFALGRKPAEIIDLVDRPGGRKHHKGNIPLIGGIGIFVMVVAGLLISGSVPNFISILLIFLSFMLVLGLVDDLYQVSWHLRLLVQVICSLGVILFTGLYVTDIGAFISSPQVELGSWGILFTIFAVVALTNAINMVDGHDGLAGATTLVVILGISLFQPSILKDDDFLLLILIGVSLFLVFNLNPNARIKVFLGNSGSFLLGFTVSWMLIFYSQTENANAARVYVWMVAIPTFDFISDNYAFSSKKEVIFG